MTIIASSLGIMLTRPLKFMRNTFSPTGVSESLYSGDCDGKDTASCIIQGSKQAIRFRSFRSAGLETAFITALVSSSPALPIRAPGVTATAFDETRARLATKEVAGRTDSTRDQPRPAETGRDDS